MAKASDNNFPSVLFAEGTTPASPAAGSQRLFIDSADHKVKRVNSSGTVTTVEGGGGSSSNTPLVVVSYNPATQVTTTTTSTTFAALDTTNLAATFTAPTSGKVLVRLHAVGYSSVSTGPSLRWAIISAGSVLAGSQRYMTSATAPLALTSTIEITGLTSGTSYTFQWAHASDSAGTGVTTTYGGPTSGLGSVGQAIMEVWAV